MIYNSAVQHAKNLNAGAYTSLELTKAYFDRIHQFNPAINALVHLNESESLDLAKLLDDKRPTLEQPGPLYGVPVTVKECFKMAGTPTTINFPPLKNYVAHEDSIIVERLKQAGAIILGKTNVPTLLSDAQTFGPLYPTCNNPYDLQRVPGGSTGGGAAAVAAGMTSFEIGSDIGGSIRNPSHFCGLFGLKPTHNGHAQDGHVPPFPGNKMGFSAMNCTGPLARSMEDIELAYNICYSPRWDYLRYLPVARDYPRELPLSGYTFASFDTLVGLQAGKDVRTAMDKMTEALEAQGATVKRIQLDLQLTERILQNWARLFGFVIGQENSWPKRKIINFLFNRDLKGSRIPAAKALKEGLSLDFRHFTYALHEQQETIAEFNKYYDQYDFILSPTCVGPAFKHNHKHQDIDLDGEPIAYTDYCFLFVMLFNQLQNPVLNIPTGLNNEGLPIGLSLSGPHFSEQQLIHVGKLIEAEGFAFQAPEL